MLCQVFRDMLNMPCLKLDKLKTQAGAAGLFNFLAKLQLQRSAVIAIKRIKRKTNIQPKVSPKSSKASLFLPSR